MKYDLNILNKYIFDGLVIKQDHPKYPISIYNYSRICQYDGIWDEITMACRGLILDREGNVIAKPFPKFFNYEELVGMTFRPSTIPNEPFSVYEKMDGSLGIVFCYDNKWHVATRGSFTSEQAVKGAEILKKYDTDFLSPGYTYLFEIIYPENRIVVDYGKDEKLVMLACIDCSADGIESDIHIPYYMDNFDVVKKYDGINEFEQLKQTISNDAEGYIVQFQSGMRMKIKGTEYIRLHKILTNFSTTDIWELLRDGKPLDEFLDRVPDEFDTWVRQTISNLKYAHFSVGERCGKTHDYFRYGKYGDVYPEPTKKEFAEHVMKYVDAPLRSVCFAIWDGKPYDHIAWKLVKPKWSKPFLKNFEQI
jgi:RNA ligase